MTKIRINPDELNATSQKMAGIRQRLSGLGGELMRISGSAPSYQGQFAPRVLGLSSQAHLKVINRSNQLGNQSSRLARIAKRFAQADSDFGQSGGLSGFFKTIIDKVRGFFGGVSPHIFAQLGTIFSLGNLFTTPAPWNPSPAYASDDGKNAGARKSFRISLFFGTILGSFLNILNKVLGRDKPKETISPKSEGVITDSGATIQVDPSLLPKSPFVTGWKLNGSFGLYFNNTMVHNGLDIAPSNNGSPEIHPIGPGKVVLVKSTYGKDENGNSILTGFGHHIVVEHKLADGRIIRSNYAHMAEPSKFKVGDEVDHNSVLGTMGASGNATGPHLHLDIHEVDKKSLVYLDQINNPRKYKPNDPIGQNKYGLPETMTYLEEVKHSWIDPSELLNPENAGAYQFVPVEQW